MNRSIEVFLHNNRKVTDTVLLILSSVSAFFTYQGAVLVLDSSGPQSAFSLSAAVFSAGVSAAIFLFWRYALGIVPVMNTRKNRWLGMSVIGLGGVFIVCLSSWMNVMALAGAGALTAHMRGSMKDYEAALQAAYIQAKAMDSLAGDLNLAAQRYGALADREIRQGTLTGVPGAGGVADSLRTTQKGFADLVSLVSARSKQVDSLYAQGQTALGTMGSLVAAEGPVAGRYTAYAEEASKVAKIVGTLNSRELSSVIARTVRSFSGGTGLFNPSSSNRSVASAQGDALQRLASDLTGTGERIATAAEELARAQKEEPPAFERIGLSKAVVLYFDELLPYWAGGVGLDLMPVVLILLLMLLYHAAAEPPPTDPDVDGMPFGQVRKVLVALEQTKSASSGGGSLTTQALPTRTAEGAPIRSVSSEAPRLTAFDEDEWKNHLNGGN